MSYEMKTAEFSAERAMTYALLTRAGIPLKEEERKQASVYLGYSNVEFSRECLRLKGQNKEGLRGDPLEEFNRAMTTSDFPIVLSDVVGKTVDYTYKNAPGTFMKIASKGETQDFRESSFLRFAGPVDFPEVSEDNEFVRCDLVEGEEKGRVKTYGGLVGLSRQAIVNDDQGVFRDLLRVLGVTCKQTQNRIFYKLLLANPNLSDGKALYHVDRSNLLTGVDSALSATSLGLGVKAMRMMVDDAGNNLAIEPKYLLVPPSLEVAAWQLCYSESIPGQDNAGVPNMFRKLGIEPVVEPLLENPTITGFSATAWYLFPEPELAPVIKALSLVGGDNTPYLEEKTMFKRDEIQYKARIDFGAAAVSYRSVKSAGV